MRYLVGLLAAAILAFPDISAALQAGPNDLYVRVVDVGPGLCVVTKAPPGTFFVYDAGHWVGKRCIEAVREIVTSDRIELLVLSHSDADHLGDAAEILEGHFVPIILRAGDVRTTSTTWQKTNDAIAGEVREGATVINFRSLMLTTGLRLDVGEAAVVVVGGFADWTAPGPTESERERYNPDCAPRLTSRRPSPRAGGGASVSLDDSCNALAVRADECRDARGRHTNHMELFYQVISGAGGD